MRQGNIGDVRQELRSNLMKSMRLQEIGECTICQEDFIAPCSIVVLGCNKNHFYHDDCLEEWTKSLEARNLSLSCPICRTVY